MPSTKLKFLTAVFLLLPIFTGCNPLNPFTVAQTDKKSGESDKKIWGEPKILATVTDDAITESSGLVASRKNKDILWTHNDSGDDAFIFALDLNGKRRGVWKVSGAKNIDWEDIAAFKSTKTGETLLYIGDIGNNEKAKTEFTVYLVKEPKVDAKSASSNKKQPLLTEKAIAVRLKYPAGNEDAETLMVHPQSGDLYILTKTFSGASGVYRLRAPFSLDKVNTLEKVGDVSVPSIPNGLLTGGDISPDGKRVVLVDYLGAFEFTIPENAKNFDAIWKEKPKSIELGERKQGEAICYGLDGNTIYATSEKKNSPLIEVKQK